MTTGLTRLLSAPSWLLFLTSFWWLGSSMSCELPKEIHTYLLEAMMVR